MARKRQSEDRPWGMLFGLLMAAAITLVGIARSMDPLVILYRAVLAAILVGILVRCTLLLGHSVTRRSSRTYV